MLFHTVPFFFLSMVAQKTSKLRYSDWLLRNFNQSESGYLSYHGEQNGGHHAKEHWKLSWKLVSKNSLHFVGSHHSEKQTVDPIIWTQLIYMLLFSVTLSSCIYLFEFPPQKSERKGGWEPCFALKLGLTFRVLIRPYFKYIIITSTQPYERTLDLTSDQFDATSYIVSV